jgi:uncharacterized protein YneF (UPF0154 family)
MPAITQERNDPMTFEQLREMFQEIGRKQEETAREIKETERILRESGKDVDRRITEVSQ